MEHAPHVIQAINPKVELVSFLAKTKIHSVNHSTLVVFVQDVMLDISTIKQLDLVNH